MKWMAVALFALALLVVSLAVARQPAGKGLPGRERVLADADSGLGWAREPWAAVQRASREALRRRVAEAA